MSVPVLNEPVLELNNAWVPVGTCTVRNAFEKVFAERAKIMDVNDAACSLHDFMAWAELPPIEGHQVIRTAQMHIRAPEVIVLASDARIGKRRKVIAFSRTNLLKRDNHTCQYCGKTPPEISVKDMTIDHVYPRANGGRGGWLNCVAACFPCNSKKGKRTPEEANMTLLGKPFEPRWSPIFRVHAQKIKPSWAHFLSPSQN